MSQQLDDVIGMIDEVNVGKTEVRVQATHKVSGEETLVRDEKQIINEQFFSKEPPKIWMDYGITKNLGNYESLKFNVGVSVPVGKPIPEELTEEIKKAYDYASTIIGKVVEAELSKTVELLQAKSYGK